MPTINPNPKILPVFILADRSNSMKKDDKIGQLNKAIREMITNYQESDMRGLISVAVITFGGRVALHLPLTVAKNITWTEDLKTESGTPLGGALQLAATLLEDETLVPIRDYRPILILASDGQPTDKWQEPLAALNRAKRGSHADRLALAIGADADEVMLNQFIEHAKQSGSSAAGVYKATEAGGIRKFFQYVKYISTKRRTSPNPDAAVPLGKVIDLTPDL